MKKFTIIFLLMGAFLISCENKDWEFPDFDYSTVYFAYQTPVRTLVLGEDYTFDNTLDNEYKCRIMATLGGVYENEQNIEIEVSIDNSLCENLHIDSDSGKIVSAMPASYYSLPQDMRIVIPEGKLIGGIEVQLTDAFFNDPLSYEINYVIPMVMQNVTNADSILSGIPVTEDPDRRVAADWSTLPKDYVLYAVKYMNPWAANYLRRGVETVDGTIRSAYHEEYTEQDMVATAVTTGRNSVGIQLDALNADETKTPFYLLLDFDASGNCMASASDTAGYSITGSGRYVEDGDQWGGESRNVLYLDYEVDLGSSVHQFTDTLVLRDRGIALETFMSVVSD